MKKNTKVKYIKTDKEMRSKYKHPEETWLDERCKQIQDHHREDRKLRLNGQMNQKVENSKI